MNKDTNKDETHTLGSLNDHPTPCPLSHISGALLCFCVYCTFECSVYAFAFPSNGGDTKNFFLLSPAAYSLGWMQAWGNFDTRRDCFLFYFTFGGVDARKGLVLFYLLEL